MILTPIQLKAVRYIATTARERGYPPTIRELGEHLGRSAGAVQEMLGKLQDKKVIRREADKPRALAVIDAETKCRCEHRLEDHDHWYGIRECAFCECPDFEEER